MSFRSKIYDLEIEKMQITSVLTVFVGVSFLFLALLSFGSMGPNKLLVEQINSVSCEDQLTFPADSSVFPNKDKEGIESYKCILCKQLDPSHLSKIQNLQLDLYVPEKEESLYKDLDSRFQMSLLETSKFSKSCENLASITKMSLFPNVDSDLLFKMNRESKKISEGVWDLRSNNISMNGAPDCESTDDPKTSKCVINVFGNINYHETASKIAILFSLPLSKAQKEKLQKLEFYSISNNKAFDQFVLFYQVAISIASLLAFLFILSRLSKYQKKDWLSLHKWILALLLTQAFLDNSFSILNDYFESRVFEFLSELGKNIHLTLLLYFWTSVFDKILIQHLSNILFNEWIEKIKVTLLTSFFILNFSYNFYIGIQSLDNDYQDIFQLKIILDFIKFLITFLEICYGFYFIIMTYLFIKLVKEGKITKDRASVILFSFTCISFIVTTLSLIISPYSESSFEYFAVRGFISIYTITVGILYTPSRLKKQASELDMTTMNERDEIIKNAYESEGVAEEKQSLDNDPEKQKKKLIWERIQKQVETEEEDIKPDKAELEDEEYIYM